MKFQHHCQWLLSANQQTSRSQALPSIKQRRKQKTEDHLREEQLQTIKSFIIKKQKIQWGGSAELSWVLWMWQIIYWYIITTANEVQRISSQQRICIECGVILKLSCHASLNNVSEHSQVSTSSVHQMSSGVLWMCGRMFEVCAARKINVF